MNTINHRFPVMVARVVVILAITLVAGGCTNMSHLVPATPLEKGETRVVLSHGAVIHPEALGFAADAAVQRGITDWFNLGGRFGFPHGLSVHGLFNLFDSQHFALSLNPSFNINWWFIGEDLNHGRIELPLVIGLKPTEEVEFTLTASYGGQFYWERDHQDPESYRPETAQFVTGQLAILLPLAGRTQIMPYFSYSHFVNGLRPGGSVHMSAGIAVVIR